VCAKDLQKTSKLSGVEQRKAFAELLKYECVEALPWAYVVYPQERATGKPEESVVRVALGLDAELTRCFTSKEYEMSDVVKIGWLLNSAVVKATKKDIAARFTVSESKPSDAKR
jgi:hypothetical protein